jgi:putative phage-type endonuclease
MSALIQQTEEWLKLRKSKIGASDAPVIMGQSPWKTPYQLWEDKLSPILGTEKTSSMQRGIDLEETARELFTIKTGIKVSPKVLFHKNYEWMMASLDGISDCHKYVIEIKCPGPFDHSIALSGKIPDHYYPQLQHQMEVCDVEEMIYFSFDGYDGTIVMVSKNPKYIEKLLEEEEKFYECMQTKQPPELTNKDYKEKTDELWQQYASKWKSTYQRLKSLEKEEEFLRNQLIMLAGQSNSQGAGIKVSKMMRKGNVDLNRLSGDLRIDLEKYRKNPIESWRISST